MSSRHKLAVRPLTLAIQARGANRHGLGGGGAGAGADPAPQPGQAHPVAEGVGDDGGGQAGGADEDEGAEEAEERGVGELEERACDAGDDGRVRVRDAELVEVVHVGDAEVERRHEDGRRRRDVGGQVQRDDERAPDQLFGGRALRGCDGMVSSRWSVFFFLVGL